MEYARSGSNIKVERMEYRASRSGEISLYLLLIRPMSHLSLRLYRVDRGRGQRTVAFLDILYHHTMAAARTSTYNMSIFIACASRFRA
jgi:hypothetical protein